MRSNPKKQSLLQAFTVVELLIVVVVIGIISTLILVAYNNVQVQAAQASLVSDLKNASTQLGATTASSANSGSTSLYPSDLSAITKSSTTNFEYTSTATSYCITATSNNPKVPQFYITQTGGVTQGACSGHYTYEDAPVSGGNQTNFTGYNGREPAACPSTGGSWIKVPGNTLYNKPNGFCVQQYPANNVSSVPTSQATGPRWTAITEPAAKTAAESLLANSHLFSEDEWMTIATNAAAQPANWSGGSVGNGTLPIGSASAAYGGASVVLSNGQRIYFDTGSTSYYASTEWTCYTGQNADTCGLAQQYQPQPAYGYYTDQANGITSFGNITNANGYYYGDPRYANPNLVPYVNASRNNGLGYFRSNYASGSSTVYTFERGAWTGANSSGIFNLNINTLQNYAHAIFGFRVAK